MKQVDDKHEERPPSRSRSERLRQAGQNLLNLATIVDPDSTATMEKELAESKRRVELLDQQFEQRRKLLEGLLNDTKVGEEHPEVEHCPAVQEPKPIKRAPKSLLQLRKEVEQLDLKLKNLDPTYESTEVRERSSGSRKPSCPSSSSSRVLVVRPSTPKSLSKRLSEEEEKRLEMLLSKPIPNPYLQGDLWERNQDLQQKVKVFSFKSRTTSPLFDAPRVWSIAQIEAKLVHVNRTRLKVGAVRISQLVREAREELAHLQRNVLKLEY